MPTKQPTKRRRSAAKPQQQPATAKRQDEARPPAELLQEYDAAMAEHREGYMAYERAHLAMRAGKLSEAQAKRVKAQHRDAHRLYWRAYEKARVLKRAGGQ